jgi:hypothetical protein
VEEVKERREERRRGEEEWRENRRMEREEKGGEKEKGGEVEQPLRLSSWRLHPASAWPPCRGHASVDRRAERCDLT